ncbi:MAG: bifunctional nicotinamidase/pyrazinamidase [Leptospiraceae bacterium]|nr:bifunctional nicotinamidase/pyrazinamidase [Leptospiraceae bacterium]MCP5500922.1 bifunctional nicotinamidase/pyrazinamidase [Leptospiraceae bacterium]
MTNCLILVDLQYDFMPGGALAVQEGDRVVPIANHIMENFSMIVSTQDWHPADHGSFASQHSGKKPGDLIDLHGLQQVLWPDHCVMNTEGAKFHKDLRIEKIQKVFPKGQEKTVDSYSGFFDNGKRKATGMHEYLKENGVKKIFVCGLALDFCVKFTAVDAKELGYDTYLIEDACRAVNLSPGDDKKAIEDMKALGIHCISSSDIEKYNV